MKSLQNQRFNTNLWIYHPSSPAQKKKQSLRVVLDIKLIGLSHLLEHLFIKETVCEQMFAMQSVFS